MELNDNSYWPSASLAGADIFFLAESFGLDPIIFIKDLGGAYNLNLLLKTKQGGYVLRVHRPWVTQQRLEQLQRVKEMLARAEFPVPLPLPTTSGETILRYKGRLVEVEPFIVHDGEADTWERNVTAFSLLGRLHSFLAAHSASISLVEPVVSNYGTPDMLLAWTQEAAEKVAQAQSTQSNPSQATQSALSLYAETMQLLSTLQSRWQPMKEHLPRQLTHGDYGGAISSFSRSESWLSSISTFCA